MATVVLRAAIAGVLVVWCSRAAGLVIIEQLSPCKVNTDQGFVDFSSLAGTSEEPGFPNIASPAGVTRKYDWNPCIDFKESKEKSTKNCQGVALCRIDDNLFGSSLVSSAYPKIPTAIRYYSFGNQSSATFVSNGDDQLVLQMQNPHQAETTARVILKCNNTDDMVQCIDDADSNNPTFVLTGRQVCFSALPSGRGISIGTVLCVTLLVVAVLYAAIGATYLRVRRNASGAQLIPNVEFWRALPGYAKDGFLCVKARCRAQALTYESA